MQKRDDETGERWDVPAGFQKLHVAAGMEVRDWQRQLFEMGKEMTLTDWIPCTTDPVRDG